MPNNDIQPPRERTPLDDEIATAEEEVRRLTSWRRIFWGSILIWLLIGVCAITIASITHNQNWSSGVIVWISFTIAAFMVGGLATSNGDLSLPIGRMQYFSAVTQFERLKARRREQRSGRTKSKLALYQRYKESLPELVERYRLVANHYRGIYNSLQAFIVVGALAASTLAGALDSVDWARWTAVGLSSAVGICSAIGSHFKLNERSTEMQKAADLIEIELRAIEFGIGNYEDNGQEMRLKKFVERVEQIRIDHLTQKRQLDQPSDVSFVDSSSIG